LVDKNVLRVGTSLLGLGDWTEQMAQLVRQEAGALNRLDGTWAILAHVYRLGAILKWFQEREEEELAVERKVEPTYDFQLN
jgi:hypothetical protein